jgi:phosphoribosyl 1,2-cyclic phosphate phosphodiesterase
VLITHEHYDHVGGIDDLRPFTFERDLPLYADDYACRHLRQRLPYCLVNHSYPGIPRLDLQELKEGDRLQFGTVAVTALRVMHGELPIIGYRIGDVAYLTDMTELFDSSLPLIKDIKLLIIGALRHTPHKTHQTVEHAIAFSRSLGNIPTYLIHMSHQAGLHAIEEKRLPLGFHYAYDGLVLEI